MAANVPQESDVSLLVQQPLERAQPIVPPSLHTELLQIMDAHDPSFVMREGALMNIDQYKRSIPVPILPIQPIQPPFQPPTHQDAHYSPVNGSVLPSWDANVHVPHTPAGPSSGVKATTPSSADANRNTLAKDIIRALRPPSTKRKRDDPQVRESRDTNVSLDSPLVKKSRAEPTGEASRTGAVRSVANKLVGVWNPRNGSELAPAAPVKQPPGLGFDLRSLPAVQYSPTSWQGQPSSYYPPVNPQWGPMAQPHVRPQNSIYPVGPSNRHPPNSFMSSQPYSWSPSTWGSSSIPFRQYQPPVAPSPEGRPLVTQQPAVPSPQARPLVTQQPAVPSPQARPLVTQQPAVPSPRARPLETQQPAVPLPRARPLETQQPAVPSPRARPLETQQPAMPSPRARPLETQQPAVPSPRARPLETQQPAVPLPRARPLETQQPAMPSPQARFLKTQQPVAPSPEERLLEAQSLVMPSPERRFLEAHPPERRLLEARPTEEGPSAPSLQQQIANVEFSSVPPTSSATSLPASRYSSEPVFSNSSSSPLELPVSRQPLFLPSSESPPPHIPGSPLPLRRHPGLIPVVELGPSPKKLRAKAHLVKGSDLSKADASFTITSSNPAAADSVVDTEPLFGRPTGALAVASGSESVENSAGLSLQQGLRRSRSQVYVLIPRVDKRAWLLPRGSMAKGKANHFPQKEQTAERRRRNVEDSFHVQDFARRLIRRRCLWKGCQAVLDSTEKFLKHVKIIHGTQDGDQLFRCHWKECHSNSTHADSERLIRHLQWHVTARMYCAYKDCDFQTQLADPLVEHIAVDHDENDVLRPIAVPSDLVAPNLPAQVESFLPSYLSISRQVTGRPISKDRHQKIGPWVTHRISSQVHFRKGAINATLPLRSQRLGRQMHPTPDEMPEEAARFELRDEYEFTREEVPARCFKPLLQLPHLINDIDVVHGYLVDDVPVMSEPGSVSPPTKPEEAAVASILEAEDSHTIGRRMPVSEGTDQGVVGAVREDVDSREVEELL